QRGDQERGARLLDPGLAHPLGCGRLLHSRRRRLARPRRLPARLPGARHRLTGALLRDPAPQVVPGSRLRKVGRIPGRPPPQPLHLLVRDVLLPEEALPRQIPRHVLAGAHQVPPLRLLPAQPLEHLLPVRDIPLPLLARMRGQLPLQVRSQPLRGAERWHRPVDGVRRPVPVLDLLAHLLVDPVRFHLTGLVVPFVDHHAPLTRSRSSSTARPRWRSAISSATRHASPSSRDSISSSASRARATAAAVSSTSGTYRLGTGCSRSVGSGSATSRMSATAVSVWVRIGSSTGSRSSTTS